jgi:hypothetical protein
LSAAGLLRRTSLRVVLGVLFRADLGAKRGRNEQHQEHGRY